MDKHKTITSKEKLIIGISVVLSVVITIIIFFISAIIFGFATSIFFQ